MFRYILNLFDENTVPTSEQVQAFLSTLPKAELLKLGNLQTVIAEVRQEEKGKLYNNITTLQESVRTLTQRAEAADQEKQTALAEAETKRRAEMNWEDRMRTQQEDFQKQLLTSKQESDAKLNEVLSSMQMQRVDSLRREVAAAAGLPVKFYKFVTGTTPEEIGASVAELSASINEIKASVSPPVPTVPVVAQPGTLPNPSGLLPQPPTNGGVFNPGNNPQPGSALSVSTDDYMDDPEKREAAKRAAIAEFNKLKSAV